MAWTFLLKSAQFFRFKNWCKITSRKKSSLTSARARAGQGGKLPFLSKNAFFGQKKAYFQKVHFMQKCSVTQNTVFQCVKNSFLLSQKKLIFFTILNLHIKQDLSITLSYSCSIQHAYFIGKIFGYVPSECVLQILRWSQIVFYGSHTQVEGAFSLRDS